MSDDPPFLPVGTEISAKFKGAFCEAKVKKAVRNVKCKVTFKDAHGGSAVLDEISIKGTIRVGALLPVVHPDTKHVVSAVIQNVKDCSTYTVVFDDGDEKVLRRTQMCLKGGKHFHASESLDVMPLTKPEQFGAPVVGRRKRGRKKRNLVPTVDAGSGSSSSSDDDEATTSRAADTEESVGSGAESESKRSQSNAPSASFYSTGAHASDYGRVVCVYEQAESRRWFPALIVSPKMKKNLKINISEEYLVRSFKDGRCTVVQKTRVKDFNLTKGRKVDISSIKAAVEKAVLYLEKDELPAHWDRELLLGERDDEEPTVEQASSPGSVKSAGDAGSSPVQGTSGDGKRVKEGGSCEEHDEKDDSEDEYRPDSTAGSGEADGKSVESDVDSRRSPEVGVGYGDELVSSSADRQSRTSPGNVGQRRSAALTKRRTQQRRRGPGAAVSSERKDMFVAQLYKFMDERGTPLNKAPVLAGKELDLYQFYDTVKKLGGYNRVCHKAEWKTVIKKMKLTGATAVTVKNAYNRYLFSFDSFYRKLGCALSDVKSTPGASRVIRRERHTSKSGTKSTPSASPGPSETTTRRQSATSKSQNSSKESASNWQKSLGGGGSSTVLKTPLSQSEQLIPKAFSSREPSKERSASPVTSLAACHPPVADDELVMGARVKVQYGSGGNRKLYQAKIVKQIPGENRYIVHYLGWNTRYDETVPKSRIVEVVSAAMAASSDSGVSNNDQGENGGPMGSQKLMRSNSRAHTGMWRRRRSSGGSTHSLPVGMATNDDNSTTNSARKASSISAAGWRKVEPVEAPDDGDESAREANDVLATYRTKPEQKTLPAETSSPNVAVKRPASANATSVGNAEKNDETIGDATTGPPRKRGKRATNTTVSKRKRSVDGSEDDEEKSSTGGGARRVSKRLRGVKASIEDEIRKKVEAAQSEVEEDEEEEKREVETNSKAKLTIPSADEATKLVPMEKVEEQCPSVKEGEVLAATTGPQEENATESAMENEDGGQSKEEREEAGENGQRNAETMEPAEMESRVKTEEMAEEAKVNETEKRKEGAGTGGPKGRGTKMRRRRRNYSQMVTDNRGRSTASKAAKREVDSDGEGGGHATGSGAGGGTSHGSRHYEGNSPRDQNSLHALRQRLQAEMDADPDKFQSNFTFNVIDESLDSERKVQVMQSNITELKETYARIRSELLAFEKCRKKLLEKKRRQEKRVSKSSSKKTAAGDSGKKHSATTGNDGNKETDVVSPSCSTLQDTGD